MIEFGTYSFGDVEVTISGPGGSFDIKSAGVSEEGISLVQTVEKDLMTIGSNGDGMHTLIMNDAARLEISLLKTAPGNNLMSYMYNFQKTSSALWGRNQVVIQNPKTGDNIMLLGGAFTKQADNSYRSQANLIVWPFLFISRTELLGNGGNPRTLAFIPAT